MAGRIVISNTHKLIYLSIAIIMDKSEGPLVIVVLLFADFLCAAQVLLPASILRSRAICHYYTFQPDVFPCQICCFVIRSEFQ
jgi:hypothetical protein